MPVYNIIYNTRNTYSSRIQEAVLEFLILPATTNDQEILDYKIETFPNARPYIGKNLFGFEALRFRLKNLEKHFTFTLNATVKKEIVNPFGFIPLPLEEERTLLQSDSFIIDHFPYLNITDLTELPEDYDHLKIDAYESVLDFVRRVNSYLHSFISYDKDIKDPHRKLSETILEKRGVCQDYAHFMLAILRLNSIPARYVSGYLSQEENVVGAGAVHAWVQTLIPGIGWVGFDPVNNHLEDHHYIKIVHGVDITDCATIKGAIKGPGTNIADYQVIVKEQQTKSANQ